jgi:hypothetical protein
MNGRKERDRLWDYRSTEQVKVSAPRARAAIEACMLWPAPSLFPLVPEEEDDEVLVVLLPVAEARIDDGIVPIDPEPHFSVKRELISVLRFEALSVDERLVRRALLQSVHNAVVFWAKVVRRLSSETAFKEVKEVMDTFAPVDVWILLPKEKSDRIRLWAQTDNHPSVSPTHVKVCAMQSWSLAVVSSRQAAVL